jgi:GT2 family glycosyltransferase
MTLSVVIVNYNTERLLKACLESVYAGVNGTPLDIWVVDNHSQDQSVTMVRSLFPRVKIIENPSNVGFSRANNLVVAQSQSDYILLLNPDTLIIGDAIERVVKFMKEHPEVGIAGCKVLNRDGTLQLACRRSIPTPKVAFYRLSGLSRLFPKSRIMARYNMTYEDPEQTHEVDAVSGAFLMIRRKVVEQIGLLDERFFMYGEELDWCLRAKRAGWTVMYYPDARIVHYKGESTKYNSRKAAVEFYRAMYLFHKKHFAGDCSLLTNLLIYTGILVRALGSWRKLVFPTPASGRRPPTEESSACGMGTHADGPPRLGRNDGRRKMKPGSIELM